MDIKNLLLNAKIGDKFITRNGKIAIYWRIDSVTKWYMFIIDDKHGFFSVFEDGRRSMTSNITGDFDIIEKYEKQDIDIKDSLPNNDLLLNVKFGDKFITRNGKTVIYWHIDPLTKYHTFITDTWAGYFCTFDNGSFNDGLRSMPSNEINDFDIIDKYDNSY